MQASTIKVRSHFHCHQCNIPFSAERALKKHLKINSRHTSVKPYHCPSCALAFPEKPSLVRHQRRLHPSFPTAESTPSNVIPTKRRFSTLGETDGTFSFDHFDSDDVDFDFGDLIDHYGGSNCSLMDLDALDSAQQWEYLELVSKPSAECTTDHSGDTAPLSGSAGSGPVSNEEVPELSRSNSPESVRSSASSRQASPSTSFVN